MLEFQFIVELVLVSDSVHTALSFVVVFHVSLSLLEESFLCFQDLVVPELWFQLLLDELAKFPLIRIVLMLVNGVAIVPVQDVLWGII